MSRRRKAQFYLACLAAASPSISRGTPTVQSLSDSHGQYYLANNGSLQFQLYKTGSLAGKITSLIYDSQQMVGSKGFYYDIQGTPGIFLGSAETYAVRSGSNFVDISATHAATATEPLEVTWHWVLRDGESAFSSYLTYHHTAAMADYATNENRMGAQFYNGSLFHYSSITDNFWGYQAAGDPARDQGRFITGETADMKGIPSEYIKSYETKYDWRSTYAESGGVTGIVTAANTSSATRPLVANDYGAWTIENYRSYESWNAGPTHPQTPVADGASIIPSPPGSHFGGPGTVFTGNMDKAFGPIVNYFNKGTDINSLRNDAKKYTTGAGSDDLNNFFDSINLPMYATTAQRGTVSGKVRLADGSSMDGATVILTDFNSAAYAADPLSQEYQRHVNGYNYWVTPNKDGTFTMPDVRPGTYRVTVIKPGAYREGTYDNVTVTAGNTTKVPNFTFVPDISGKAQWQVGTFDRSAGEFKHGDEHNNWLDTFDYSKDFPSGVNYTVNASNPVNDKDNWKNNWGLNQINGTQDFWKVNFNLTSAPAANAVVTITVAIANQQFINDLGALIGSNRVDAGFDHSADNAPGTFRSGETSSRVLYRKLTFPGSWLHAGTNTVNFHIVGGNMQWDAVRMDIQDPGTLSMVQWNGSNGNWTDSTQWKSQQYGYTGINKGTSGIANDTSTSFLDGAASVAPVNNAGSQQFYDAFINGGSVNLNASVGVQKFSLLEGTLTVTGGSQTLTVNDAFALAGGTANGAGSINALSTTTINLANTISGGFKVNSTGAVSWTDGASLVVTGNGSQWNTPGFTMGQTAASTLTISGGGLVSTGGGSLSIGSFGVVSLNSGSLNGSSISNNGSLTADASSTISAGGGLTNSGTAVINGTVAGGNVTNNAGLLVLNGSNTYTGDTTINGGAIQFGALSSIGGAGKQVIVNAGGAIAFTPGVMTAGFLSKISPSSTGALALTSIDNATDLDFTAGPLAALPPMAIGAVGNVAYIGNYTPAGGTYRLGGGGGTLTFTPVISGSSNVIIGNTGSSGTVVLNATNTYLPGTEIRGGVLSVNTLANGGVASPIGMSSNVAGNLIIDGGTLATTGAATTDRLFIIGPRGATLDGSGGAMNWTNDLQLSASGSGNRTFTLTGSNNNTFTPGIVDPSSGQTSLTKDGSGVWTLNSAINSYSGNTTVLGGTLQFGANAGLPNGLGKGNLVVGLNGAVQMNGNDLSINGLNDGPAPSTGPGPNGNGGGTINNNGSARTLTLGNNNASGQFSGVISGAVNLVKNGSGVQIISGDNTYSGTTTINDGAIQIGVGGTPLSFGPGDGGFKGKLGTGNIINNATLIFNRGYFTTASNPISGSGTLKQIANAELALGQANTYTGPTIIGGGIPEIGQDGSGLSFTGDSSINASVIANGGQTSSIGASSNAASNLILDGGTLFYSSTTARSTDRLFTVTPNGGAIYISGALTFSNGGAIVMSGSGDRTLSLGGDATSGGTFSSDIGDPISGKTSLTKDRSTTWTITSSAALTYSGDTNILMGTLRMGSGAALPVGAGKGNVVFGTTTDFGSDFPAILEMNGNNLSINGLSGGLTGSTYWRVNNNSSTRTLTVGNNDVSATYNGQITGGINLVKTGAGKQILAGSSTYTGTTTINSGTLAINGSVNASAVTVKNGGMLMGNGSMASLTVDAGGTVSPGNSIDSMEVLGSATINGRLFIEIDPTGTGTTDLLTITNAMTITNASLQLSVLGTLNDPAYIIASYTTLNGMFASVTNLPPGYMVNYHYNNGVSSNFIAIAVPEPSTLMIASLAAISVLPRRRRNR